MPRMSPRRDTAAAGDRDKSMVSTSFRDRTHRGPEWPVPGCGVASGGDLVEDVEGVVHLDPADRAEAGVRTQPADGVFVESAGAQPRPVLRERGGQAEEHADSVEVRAERTGVVLQPVAGVDVQADVPAVRTQRAAD